ncbi:AprI/Inh family metalloprotease inhibitor [Methylobacterium durans]|uniref:AprI/Inh family metalloprotease inhibitor n=1 Tax=Methylobacterium durans TaxID=2202825 RepID=UPI002AFF8BD0|nr:AprI/Inh family metalloprotease inhibitor [Methylobacterium durans]MEA1831280.1 AprI/Inh family metalloprotease inhibitor [Methylobacterium durans]
MRRALAALLLATGAAQAQDTPPPPEPFVASLPETAGGVPGTWDLSRDGSTRRCVMTLTGESGEAGRRLFFPAGCRKALPIMNGIAGWLFTDGTMRLVDRNLRPVLMFARRPDQRSLLAKAETGEAYSLVPLQIQAMRPPEPAASGPAAEAGGPPPTTAAVPADPAASEPGPAPGVYALDRYQDQDVCRLSLAPRDGAAAPVHVLDGCRDNGLAIFDPVTWRYASGRLTLVAKRGHVVNLVPMGDGRWRRDPETGTTFLLRKVEGP